MISLEIKIGIGEKITFNGIIQGISRTEERELQFSASVDRKERKKPTHKGMNYSEIWKHQG